MNRPSSFSWRSPVLYIVVGVVVVLTALIAAYALELSSKTTHVQIGSQEYRLWIADTEKERVKGLSGVAAVSEKGGLLMDFQSDGQWGIWMKDMNVPIDIIWLNKDKEVVYIVENASPDTPEKTYFPFEDTRYVVELAAGAVESAGITQGSTARFSETWKGEV